MHAMLISGIELLVALAALAGAGALLVQAWDRQLEALQRRRRERRP